eukprot:8187150-Pyramimonas_sp.AAC.1
MEGDMAVKTRMGGVMGDPFMAAAFPATFQRPVRQWAGSLLELDPLNHLLLTEWDGKPVDL